MIRFVACHSSKTARASATLSLFYLEFYEGLAGPAETLSLFEKQWVGLSRNPLETPLEPPRTPLSNVPRQHSSSSQKHVLIMHVRERQDREGDRKANDATHKHQIISIK